MKGMHLAKRKEEDRMDKEETKEEKEDDTKEDDMKEKEKVSAMGGGNYFFFLFNYTHHALPHFLFIITKGMHLPFAVKGSVVKTRTISNITIK